MHRPLVRRLARRLDQAGMLRRPHLVQRPTSGGEFTSLTGLSAASLYLFDEASGTLDDKIGAADLAVTATPQFGYQSGGRAGIYYDDTTAAHAADSVNVPTAASIVAVAECRLVSTPSSLAGVLSCWTATADPGWAFYLSTSANDRPTVVVRDSGANSRSLLGADVDWPTTYPGNWLWSIQIDRAAATVRSRVSYAGGLAGAELSGSLAGFGDIFGGTQRFTTGAGHLLGGGMWLGWAAYLTGVQCEGAAVLANLHRALGWES